MIVYRDRSAFSGRSAEDIHNSYNSAMLAAGFRLESAETSLMGSTASYTYLNTQAGIGLICTETKLIGRMQTVTISFG